MYVGTYIKNLKDPYYDVFMTVLFYVNCYMSANMKTLSSFERYFPILAPLWWSWDQNVYELKCVNKGTDETYWDGMGFITLKHIVYFLCNTV